MPAPGTEEDYLHSCLHDFPDICLKKYGTTFDFEAIENKVRRLRRKTELTYKNLSYFESPEHWWFKRFWVFPPESSLAPALEGVNFDFWNLSDENESGLIRQLLYAFKSIELVSIILRFIRPENYAIFSSPAQRLLDIRRGRDPVETYVNYLCDLREIRGHYGFRRIADVDMALWVLHERCFGAHRAFDIEKAFHEDTFLLRLRAKNLVAPLAELSDAQLANALVEVKPDLAALVACHALEALIRQLAACYGMHSSGPGLPLEQIIESLPNFGPVTAVRKAKWQMLRNARNEFIHSGTIPGVREKAILIEEVIQLEKDILAEPVAPKTAPKI
jgi:hypothetical protein